MTQKIFMHGRYVSDTHPGGRVNTAHHITPAVVHIQPQRERGRTEVRNDKRRNKQQQERHKAAFRVFAKDGFESFALENHLC